KKGRANLLRRLRNSGSEQRQCLGVSHSGDDRTAAWRAVRLFHRAGPQESRSGDRYRTDETNQIGVQQLPERANAQLSSEAESFGMEAVTSGTRDGAV